MHIRNRVAALSLAFCAPFILACGAAQAQGKGPDGFPNRPIKLVNGFQPGGSSDIVARLAALHLTERLGQPVVVETRAGAGGAIATEYVSKQPGDGYTWVLLVSGHATQAAMLKKLPYDPVNGITPLSTLTTYAMMLAIRPDAPEKTVADLIARSRANPGKVSFASAGIGTAHHLLGEWINAEARSDFVQVPFKGGTAALGDVLAGRVDFIIDTMTLLLPQVKSGKLRAIATTAAGPLDFLPGVPTVAQTVPGVIYDSWLALAASPGMSPALANWISGEIRAVLAKPEVVARLAELGGRSTPSTPDELRQRVVSDIGKWTRVVESRKIEKQ